jgi:hypothetical protein
MLAYMVLWKPSRTDERTLADEKESAMQLFIRSIAAALAASVYLWPLAAAAQEEQPVASSIISIEQVHDAFSSAGFIVDRPLDWSWTAPPVTSFAVHDATRGRELIVLVYPSASAAQAVRLQAQDSDQHLIFGYGQSVWRGNVALVQSTRTELDRAYRFQNAIDNGVFIDTSVVRASGKPNIAVDLDFLQAMVPSVVDL